VDASRVDARGCHADATTRRERRGAARRSVPGLFHALVVVTMVPYFEDDEDPKKPRPVYEAKKHEGWMEVDESRKDGDRDRRRHVHVTEC